MIRTREPGRKEQVEGPMIFGLPAAARQQTLVALQAQSILLSDAESSWSIGCVGAETRRRMRSDTATCWSRFRL
jgi:hypothetical protein